MHLHSARGDTCRHSASQQNTNRHPRSVGQGTHDKRPHNLSLSIHVQDHTSRRGVKGWWRAKKKLCGDRQVQKMAKSEAGAQPTPLSPAAAGRARRAQVLVAPCYKQTQRENALHSRHTASLLEPQLLDPLRVPDTWHVSWKVLGHPTEPISLCSLLEVFGALLSITASFFTASRCLVILLETVSEEAGLLSHISQQLKSVRPGEPSTQPSVSVHRLVSTWMPV